MPCCLTGVLFPVPIDVLEPIANTATELYSGLHGREESHLITVLTARFPQIVGSLDPK